MTATNHALTGALIGLAVGSPVVAVPAALLSHYVLDMLPHYGVEGPEFLKTRFFRNLLISDALMCVLLVLVLAVLQPQHWLLACICAFVAASPDFSYISSFIDAKRNKPHTFNLYNRIGMKIQWYAKPNGAFAEFAWLCMAFALLLGFL